MSVNTTPPQSHTNTNTHTQTHTETHAHAHPRLLPLPSHLVRTNNSTVTARAFFPPSVSRVARRLFITEPPFSSLSPVQPAAQAAHTDSTCRGESGPEERGEREEKRTEERVERRRE